MKESEPILYNTPITLPDGSIVIHHSPELVPADDSQESHLKRVAQGYFANKNRVKTNMEIKAKIESQVVKAIGNEGKYLTDKLFELIEGVYIVRDIVQDPKTKKIKSFKYYKEKPDLKAITYALDRVLGKPGEDGNYGGEKGEGLSMMSEMLKNLAQVSTNAVTIGEQRERSKHGS